MASQIVCAFSSSSENLPKSQEGFPGGLVSAMVASEVLVSSAWSNQVAVGQFPERGRPKGCLQPVLVLTTPDHNSKTWDSRRGFNVTLSQKTKEKKNSQRCNVSSQSLQSASEPFLESSWELHVGRPCSLQKFLGWQAFSLSNEVSENYEKNSIIITGDRSRLPYPMSSLT